MNMYTTGLHAGIIDAMRRDNEATQARMLETMRSLHAALAKEREETARLRAENAAAVGSHRRESADLAARHAAGKEAVEAHFRSEWAKQYELLRRAIAYVLAGRSAARLQTDLLFAALLEAAPSHPLLAPTDRISTDGVAMLEIQCRHEDRQASDLVACGYPADLDLEAFVHG